MKKHLARIRKRAQRPKVAAHPNKPGSVPSVASRDLEKQEVTPRNSQGTRHSWKTDDYDAEYYEEEGEYQYEYDPDQVELEDDPPDDPERRSFDLDPSPRESFDHQEVREEPPRADAHAPDQPRNRAPERAQRAPERGDGDPDKGFLKGGWNSLFTLLAVFVCGAFMCWLLFRCGVLPNHMSDEVASLKTDKASKENEVKTLTAQVADSLKKVETLTKQVDDKGKELTAKTREVRTLKETKVKTLTAQVEKLKGEVASKEKELAAEKRKVTDHTATKDTAAKAFTAEKQLGALELAAERKKVVDLEAQVENHKTQVAASGNENLKTIAAKDLEVKTLTTQAAASAAREKTLTEQVTAELKNVEALKSANSDLQEVVKKREAVLLSIRSFHQAIAVNSFKSPAQEPPAEPPEENEL